MVFHLRFFLIYYFILSNSQIIVKDKKSLFDDKSIQDRLPNLPFSDKKEMIKMAENNGKIVIGYETYLVGVTPTSKNREKDQKEINILCKSATELLTLVFERPDLLKPTIHWFKKKIKRLRDSDKTIEFVETQIS